MQRRRFTSLILLSLLIAAGNVLPAFAASLTRGPYLQSGTPTSMVIKWRTNSAVNSRVMYGTNPSSLTESKTNTSTTTRHEVLLTNLAPNTKYYYAVGSTTETLAGGDSNHYFVTSPAPGQSKPTRVWIIGDSGTADGNARAVRDAYIAYNGGRETDLWLMLGDNAYNSGTDSEYQAAVFNIYPTILRNTVLWSTLGNHDGYSADSGSQSGPYYEIFTLPKNGEAGGLPSGTEAYYSFDYGDIHFVCLDSYHTSRATNGAMMTWLASDLAATDKNWIIAFWHHPPYSKGSHDSDSETNLIQMRENALPILEAYGVDLVLGGHSHSYERSYLLDGHYGSSGSLNASMLMDNGNGRESGDGAYIKLTGGSASYHEGAVYAVAGSSGKISGGSLNHPAMVISLNTLGSMILDMDGNRLDARFLDNNRNIRDSFTLLKGTPNSDPVALDDSAETAENSAVTIAVLANDSDPDSDALTVTSLTTPGGGSAVINGNGTVTYTPHAGFSGTDAFTYTLSDGKGGIDSAVVTVRVIAANRPPLAADDSVTTNDNTPVSLNVLGNDSDPDGDPLVVTAITAPASGTAAFTPAGLITYTPALNFVGSDSLTYTVADGRGGTDTALLSIAVLSTNRPPVAVDDSAATGRNEAVNFNVLSNDTDPDGDPLVLTFLSTPANGSATFTTDGQIIYTPPTDFTGSDTFTYDMGDGRGGTASARVTITVRYINQPPVAMDDAVSTRQGNPVSGSLMANDYDPEGDPLTLIGVTIPAKGSILYNANGFATYTPYPDFTGDDSFTYEISDGQGNSDWATVSIRVTQGNRAPVAVDDRVSTHKNRPITGSVIANDKDPDGDSLTLMSVTQPAGGVVQFRADGMMRYTPDSGFTGTDSFSYSLADGKGGSDSATVTVTVVEANNPPVAVDDRVTTTQNSPLTGSLLANDKDFDGDALTLTSVTQPDNGTVEFRADGMARYTPDAGYSGIDTFSYTISDGKGGSGSATVTVTVQ